MVTAAMKLKDAYSLYGCESWTVKKAECQRSDAFELWCWRRLLIVTWIKQIASPGSVHETTVLRAGALATGRSIPVLCLQGFPYLPGEPQDEAGLLRKFEM